VPTVSRLKILAKMDIAEKRIPQDGAIALKTGERRVDLRVAENNMVGNLDAFTMTDLSTGFRRDNWSLDFFLKNAFDEHAEQTRFAQCATDTCGGQSYTVHGIPRSIGFRFSQEF